MKKFIYSLLVLAMTAFTFSSCEDVPAPYDEPSQPTTPDTPTTGKGSESDPYTVTEAIALIKSGQAPSTEVCVKGKITEVTYYNSSYSSLSYNIADEGSSEVIEVYSGKGLNGADFSSKNDLKAGQTVVVKGIVKEYTKADGTTVNEIDKNSTIISIEGDGGNTPDTPSTIDPKGAGTQADPYNCAAAIKAINAMEADKNSDNEVYIKGTVVEVKENYGDSSFGNATYYIADDANGTNKFYIFRSLYLNNEKYSSGDKLSVGDEVTVCGKVVNYKGNTPETVANNSYLYTHKSNGTPSTPDTPVTSDGISISGTTVTLANSSATAGESIKTDLSTLGYTDAQAIDKITLDDGTTIAFDANGETNGPKYYNATKGIRVYKNNKIVFTGKNNIAKIIINCDSYNGTDYVGNKTATVVFSGKTATYTNVFTGTSGGGDQLRIKTIEIVYAK